MTRPQIEPPASNAVRLATLGIDLLSALAFFLLLPHLVESFNRPSSTNGLLILGVFLLLLVSVAVLPALLRGDERPGKPRRRRSRTEKERGGCLLFGVLCVLFGYAMFLTMLLGDVSGWYPSFRSENADFTMSAFGVFVALLLAIPVAIAVGSGIDAATPDSRRGAVFQILGVIGIDLITMVTVAWWRASLGDPGSGEGVVNPLWAKLVLFSLFYILFLVFYAPPRIYLFLANRDRLGLAVFLGILAAYAWHLVSVMEL